MRLSFCREVSLRISLDKKFDQRGRENPGTKPDRIKHCMFRICRFLLFLATLPGIAHAQGRIDCDAVRSRILGQAVHYCVMLPSSYEAGATGSSKAYPVLYFLHGLGDNEQSLFNSGGWGLIEDLRKQHKIGNFLIVAPEGMRSFYINSADGKLRYSDFFLGEFIPFIETKYPVRRERQARAVTGLSMGGYGALRLAFAHPELFSSVSAQSAALITDSPQELDLAVRSGAPVGRLLGTVFGSPIDAAHWKENDPFTLARRNKSAIAHLAIYFNCGEDDDFGFEKGAKALHGELRSEGIKHEFHLYPGNHSAAYFLSHLGETMEFHSRVFEAQK
jgi:S-formylglutathione hydrolase FrmB